MFLELSILGLVILISYVVYDKFFNKMKNKRLGKLVRILLFEQVGKDKVYKGMFKGVEDEDKEIGIFINIKGVKSSISQVNSKDFFPDKEYGKCLMVCKYASDDLRPMSRMVNNEWFQKLDLPEMAYLESEEIKDEASGEVKIQLRTDEDGNHIPIVDEDGNQALTYELKPYEEPIGVQQTAREAQRFNRAFTKRMEAKRKEGDGFWDKYGQFILTAFVVVIMFLSMAYSQNKSSKTIEYALDKFAEESDKIVSSVRSGGFAQSLLDMIEKKDIEAQAPPK